LGYTPDDMIGQKAIRFVNNISLTPDQQTFLSEEDVERFDFNALFANVGDFGPIKIGSRHQDGSMRTLDIRGINLLDDDNFQGVIIFASDITEQTIAEQRLLASEKRYRQMFEQIHLPELIINPDTHSIMDVNPRAIDFFGYTLSDLHQLVFEDLCTVLSPTFDLTYYFEHGYPFTLTQIDANGTTHEMEIYPGIIDWQGKPAWYAVEVDVTQRNNAQRAIQRANMRLEQRVQQRTEQLERVKNQIETIFNNSGDGILLLNSELVIQQANYYSDWLLGMAGEEYFGTNLRDAIHTQDIPTFETAIQTIINRKVSQNIEIRIRRTDRYIDTEMSVSPVLNPAQTVGEIVVIIRDVTERKAAEAQLRYLASLPDQMQDAVISTDMNRIVRSWNKAAERMYGYTQEEAIGKVVSTLVGTEYLHGATAKSSYDTLWEQGYWEDEIIQHHRDGTPINVLASAVVTYDENGQPIGMIGVNHDFTKRKQAEDQLRYLASLQAFMTDALITVNNDGIIMSWNAAAERMYGYTEDDVLGKPLRDVLKPIFSHNESIASVWEKAYEDGFWTGEAQHQSEDAPVMFTVVSVALIRDTNGEPTGLLHLHRDDTARRLSQIAIAESEARYRLLAENVTDMISRHTPEGVYTYATPSSVHITSYTPDELVGRLAYEFFNPDDIPAVQASHAAIRENTDITTTQYRFVRKDDTKNWVETTSHSIRDANGEIIEIVAVTRDITERKQALDELKDVHERLSLATSAANVGVWEFDVPTGELFWDDGMLDLFGANRASFTGTIDEWQKRVHPEDIAEADERFVKSIESGEDLITEFRIITSDNTIRYLRAIAKNIPDETGKTVRVIGINLDITDHKQAERTLQAALESERELGELKSRIVSATSHEFRTPLASILATVETLTKYRDRLTEEKIDLRLAKIANQVQHMKDITGDMLQYTRMQSGIIEAKPEAGDLHTLCLDVVHNFNQQTEYLDRVRYQSNVDSLPYRYDPKLIRQVLNNLVHNALKYSSEDSLVHLSLEKSETQINITIRDDGIGIPSKDLHRLFDPFHRASNVGTIAGTGLGLSIVKQAIEAHNGTVQVESQLQ
ncbi:MAG: PAS domain S-box protein, partial [Chloroflexota bacterium]